MEAIRKIPENFLYINLILQLMVKSNDLLSLNV